MKLQRIQYHLCFFLKRAKQKLKPLMTFLAFPPGTQQVPLGKGDRFQCAFLNFRGPGAPGVDPLHPRLQPPPYQGELAQKDFDV